MQTGFITISPYEFFKTQFATYLSFNFLRNLKIAHSHILFGRSSTYKGLLSLHEKSQTVFIKNQYFR